MYSNSLYVIVLLIIFLLLGRCSDDIKNIANTYDHRNGSVFVPMPPSFPLDSKFKEGMFL